MRIATTIFLTDETITPMRLARELEQRGFGGLYLPEHTHIPVSRDTPTRRAANSRPSTAAPSTPSSPSPRPPPSPNA